MRKPNLFLVFSDESNGVLCTSGDIHRGGHPRGDSAQGVRSGAELQRSYSGATAEQVPSEPTHKTAQPQRKQYKRQRPQERSQDQATPYEFSRPWAQYNICQFGYRSL